MMRKHLLWLSACYLVGIGTLFAQREATLPPVQTFQSSTTSLIRIDNIDETHLLYTYRDGANSSNTDLKAVIGEVNPSTGAISFGTPTTIQASNVNHSHGVLVLSSTQAIVTYELFTANGGIGDGKAVVLTLDKGTNAITNVGASASFGTDVDAAFNHNTFSLAPLSSSSFAVAYADQDDTDNGKVKIGTVSGATITLGAGQTFSSGDIQNLWIAALSSSKVVISYEADASSDHGKAVIGDISGTTATFGSEVTFNAASTSYTAAVAVNSSQFAVLYVEDDANDFLHSKVGTVSGTSITFGSEVTVENNQDTRDITVDYLAGEEFVLAFNGGFGDNSKVRVGEVSGTNGAATIAYNTADTFLPTEADGSWITSLGPDNFAVGFVDDQSITPDDGRAIVGSLPSAAPTSATVVAKVFLEGSYNGTNLNTTINSAIPTAQPYSGVTFNNHAGTESASVPSGAVDWVLVELREAASAATANNAAKVGSAAGFLMSDGSIKATDGTTDLTISLSGNSGTEFYVIVYHRNHLPIMSASAIVESGGVYTTDLTGNATNTYQGVSALAFLVGGKFGMIAGDQNADGQVSVTDLTNWRSQNGDPFVYLSSSADFNLDGQVNAVDRNDYQQPNSGKTSRVPTN